MKKGLLITTLVAIIVVCAISMAKNFAGYEDDGYVSSRERAIIKKFDKDGDGKLGKLEQREADAAMEASKARDKKAKAEWMKRYDKDGDGKISDEEKRAARAEEGANRAAAIKKFDKDGDGKLSREEREAAGKQRDNRAAIIKEFDRDGDGKLNEEERKTARESMSDKR